MKLGGGGFQLSVKGELGGVKWPECTLKEKEKQGKKGNPS